MSVSEGMHVSEALDRQLVSPEAVFTRVMLEMTRYVRHSDFHQSDKERMYSDLDSLHRWFYRALAQGRAEMAPPVRRARPIRGFFRRAFGVD